MGPPTVSLNSVPWIVLGALLWAGLARGLVLCEKEYRSIHLGARPQQELSPLAESTSGLVKQIEDALARFRGGSASLPDRFTCSFGRCSVVSETLQEALRAVGIATQRLEVGDALVVRANGAGRRLLFYHFFLFIEGNPGREGIIIDPAYRQFMPVAARDKFPDVFVGTRDKLVEAYRQSQLGYRQTREGPESYNYLTPEDLVDRTYGFGTNSFRRRLHPAQEEGSGAKVGQP